MNILFIFLFFSVSGIYASRLITNNCHILTNRNEKTQTLNSIESLCFQDEFSI